MTFKRQVAFLADRDGEAQQSIPSGTPTVIQCNQEKLDIGNYYNVNTYTWTPQPGIYLISGHVRMFALDTNDELILRILKNGSAIYFTNTFATMNNQDPSVGLIGVTQSVGTDTYQIEVEHNQGANLNISSDPVETYFYATRI